jgi:hypothetical protein
MDKKGDPGQMKLLESIGLVDGILFRKHEDKKLNCIDDEVSAPIIVSSMSPTFTSSIQNITKEMLSSTDMKEKNNDGSGDANTQADLDFLGFELKGGFWA